MIFMTWLGGNREIFFRKFKKYLFLTTFPLDQILQTYFFSDLPILENPSLNLAGMAKTIAKELGAKKIIYSGLSLVSINGKTHCKGTGYENYILPKVSRKFSLESYRRGYKQTKTFKNELAFKKIFEDDFTVWIDDIELDTIPSQNPIELSILRKKVSFEKFQNLLQNSSQIVNSLIQNYSFSQKNLKKYLKFIKKF